MKWLFRIIGLILLLFVGLCVAGYFIPVRQVVDANVQLDADPYTVFEVVSDLKSYPEWSGIGGPESEWVFGGAADGTGQTAAWQSGARFGSLEILQSTPGEFVLVRTVGPLGEQKVTLAIQESGAMTSFLIEAQRDLGGFPYIGRVAALRQNVATQEALDRAAMGLEQMTVAQN
jgi:hypothetical protein